MRNTTATIEKTGQKASTDCPSWCVTYHGSPRPMAEEQILQKRTHSYVIGAVEDEQGLTVTAGVNVVRRDDLATGTAGTIHIEVDDARDLSVDQAKRIAGFILEAAAFIESASTRAR